MLRAINIISLKFIKIVFFSVKWLIYMMIRNYKSAPNKGIQTFEVNIKIE